MSMPQHTRKFTPEEDALIVAQSRGEFSLKELRRKLHTSVQTIKRRAADIHTELRIRHKQGGRVILASANQVDASYDATLPGITVGDDPLLQRLRVFHGERLP